MSVSISHRLTQTELGTEKFCLSCNESFPLDADFYQPRKRKRKDGSVLNTWESVCKACYREHYNKKKYENKVTL
ncbi:hypothetical protein [Acinetobacter bereziniae]|uniref:hypothetical protein n=1 Tax=Acinetobacter bereziniae TaxID=106648 RepID=UPI002952C9C3|nr:hypothetical protein [Acinetobacter bereziniae]MDV8155223.1 hypothetical protein [Acinetobacter bereziniae]